VSVEKSWKKSLEILLEIRRNKMIKIIYNLYYWLLGYDYMYCLKDKYCSPYLRSQKEIHDKLYHNKTLK